MIEGQTEKKILHDHECWHWPRLLAALDKAGFRVVPKPQLMEKGKPAKRPLV